MSKFYQFKVFEEIARAVGVAVGFALVTAVYTQGVPSTKEGLVALLVGLLPVGYAALRKAIAQVLQPAPGVGTSGAVSGEK